MRLGTYPGWKPTSANVQFLFHKENDSFLKYPGSVNRIDLISNWNTVRSSVPFTWRGAITSYDNHLMPCVLYHPCFDQRFWVKTDYTETIYYLFSEIVGLTYILCWGHEGCFICEILPCVNSDEPVRCCSRTYFASTIKLVVSICNNYFRWSTMLWYTVWHIFLPLAVYKAV